MLRDRFVNECIKDIYILLWLSYNDYYAKYVLFYCIFSTKKSNVIAQK